jgi:hypothetical protein
MQKNSAARVAAPSKNVLQPTLVPSCTPCPSLTPEDEVLMLRAELARVQSLLRDLTWATNTFVRTVI